MTTAITQIYLLMEEQNPVGAYLDKALADADCWTCNEANHYTDDADAPDYWVDEMEVTTEFEIALAT